MSHKLFDTHAHYYDARFAKESEGADVLLAEIFAGDVDTIVNVGTSLENAPICLAMAQKWQGMYAAVGIHPSDCADYELESLERFAEFLEELLNVHRFDL